MKTISEAKMKRELWTFLGNWCWAGEYVCAKSRGNHRGFGWGKRVAEHLSNYRKQVLFCML